MAFPTRAVPPWFRTTATSRTVAFLAVMALVCYARLVHWYAVALDLGFVLGTDARAYLAAAAALQHGSNPFTGAGAQWLPQGAPNPPYLYPPFLAALLVPLSGLPYSVALPLWLGCTGMGSVLLAALLQRWLPWWVALAAVSLYFPMWEGLWLGQVSIWLAVFVTLALRDLTCHSRRSGAWFAIGVLLKLTPTVALVVLWRRQEHRVVRMAIIVLVTVILVLLPHIPLALWLEGGLMAVRQPWDNPSMISVTAYLHRLPGTWGRVLEFGAVGGGLALTLCRARRIPRNFAVAAGIVLPLLIARITWDHHTLTALPVLGVIWSRGGRGRWVDTILWVLLAPGATPVLPVTLVVVWLLCLWPEVLTAKEQVVGNSNAAPEGMLAKRVARTAHRRS